MAPNTCSDNDPDPGWATAELLATACAADCLTPAWFAALAALTPESLSDSEQVQLAVATNRLVAMAESTALRALAAVPQQRCLVPSRGCPELSG